MQPSNRDLGPLGTASRRARLDRMPSRSSVATHRALFTNAAERRCDLCEALIGKEDGGSGLFLWTRGGEVRYEEPPLCTSCGPRLAAVAMRRWEQEDEEEG